MHQTPRATGIGSLPGTDTGAAHRLVFDELPDFPHLAELPGRGVGADMTGRGTAFLADLHAEVQPSGWRLVDRPGRDARRAESLLRQDLDYLEEHTQGYTGPLKIQAVGPWTLAASIELHYGDRMLADRGATRDLAESLTEGLREHVADVRRRVPGAELVLQLDEPSLPGVLRGTVPTASGFGRLWSVKETVARETLKALIDAVGAETVIHCCGPVFATGGEEQSTFEVIRKAGAAYVSFDASGIDVEDRRVDELLGQAIDEGARLMLGVVPSLDPEQPPKVAELLDKVLSLRRVGFSPERIAESVTITPTCGLAGATPPWARQALILARNTADALANVAVQ
jgi:methionine synthase II (cobalamin-independent)